MPDLRSLQQVLRHYPFRQFADLRPALRADPAEGGWHPAGTAHVRDGDGQDRQADRLQYLHAGGPGGTYRSGAARIDHEGAGNAHPPGFLEMKSPGPGAGNTVRKTHEVTKMSLVISRLAIPQQHEESSYE